MKQLSKKEIKKFFKNQPKRSKDIRIILENVEYARNVAGIFRTADAAGVSHVYLTGVSFKPPFGKDLVKASRHKEKSVRWTFEESSLTVIEQLKKEGFIIIATEIADKSIELSQLSKYTSNTDKICFLFGSEVFGVVKRTLEACDGAVYIPMYGKGASLNVATTVGIVLYTI